MIGCEDRLRKDLYCVEWGIKLYSNQQIWLPEFSKQYDYYAKSHAQSEKMQPSVTDVLCVCLPAGQNYEPYTHTLNDPLSGTTRVSRYQKGKTNLDFTEARDSEWQWHQLGHMQVCTSLQADNHATDNHSVFYRPE